MADLPAQRVPPSRSSTDARPRRSPPRAAKQLPRQRSASPGPDTVPQGPPPGYVQVNHANAPEVHALLLAQNRDWQIRNHRLLREIAYYLRCLAEGKKPDDGDALDAVNRPPEQV